MDGEFSDDLYQDDGIEGEDSSPNNQNLGIDDKVSAIMNMNLYQRYLSLLNNIGNQLTMIKHNNDILYTLTDTIVDTTIALKKLDENIRLYLKNYFINENYSKNLLYFNKCLNLLKLLNDSFDANIKKSIKSI